METVLHGVCKYVGEGPYWDYRCQELNFLDISLSEDESTLFRWNPTTNVLKSIKSGRATTFNIPCSDPKYSLISTKRDICYLNWEDHNRQFLAEVQQGNEVVRFNDGKCDNNGVLVAGTMSEEKSPGVLAKENAGVMIKFTETGGAEVMKEGFQLSNGIEWTTDGKSMFYVDSVCRKIFVYDYDPGNSNIVKLRGALNFAKYKQLDGFLPDGIVRDANNHLWVACFFGGCVVQFDIDTEEILQIIKLPTACITSCCFGGSNLTDLYVTSCTLGINNDPTRGIKEAGSLFRIPGSVHGSTGCPMNFFQMADSVNLKI